MKGLKKIHKSTSVAPSKEDIEAFNKLDAIVRKSAIAFIECGVALAEIHSKGLWRCSEMRTWEAYCSSVLGFSKPHAHRIMHAAKIANDLKELPDAPVIPVSESQVRPLMRLKSKEKQAEAWTKACAKTDGTPTAKQVLEAVVEVIEPKIHAAPRVTTKQKRLELLDQLREIDKNETSWEDAKRLINQLEGLLSPKNTPKEAQKESE